jgi:hypothetical protein
MTWRPADTPQTRRSSSALWAACPHLRKPPCKPHARRWRSILAAGGWPALQRRLQQHSKKH